MKNLIYFLVYVGTYIIWGHTDPNPGSNLNLVVQNFWKGWINVFLLEKIYYMCYRPFKFIEMDIFMENNKLI